MQTKHKRLVSILASALILCGSTTAMAADSLKDTGFNKKEQALINNLSRRFDVPENIIYATIEQESGFNRDVPCGLMQIMCDFSGIPGIPDFIDDADNPIHNIWIGIAILSYLHDYLDDGDGAWYYTLANYNGYAVDGYADSVLSRADKWKDILAERRW